MILVTGGTGNIGKDVVKGLAAAGEKVRVLTRDPAKAKALESKNVELAKGELADAKSMEAALAGVDKMFLLAPAGPDMAKQEKIAIDAAKKAGVKHVVLLSTLGADLNSPVGLAKWHAESEKNLKASGIEWTVLQPHFFMQNTLGWAPGVKKDGAFYAPAKKAKISWVDARDIADVAVAALTKSGHAGKTHVITGPEAIDFDTAAQKLSKTTGKTVKYVDVPPEAFEKSLLGFGVPAWMASDFVKLYGFFSTGGAAGVSPVVKEATGKPGRGFDDFLKDFGGAFK